MASGLPVVATRVGGVVDPIQEGVTGRLCPAGDRSALAAATLELVRDPALRVRLGEAGRARAVAVFDIKSMVRQFEDLYVSVARDGRAAPTLALGGPTH
jgi:glycosyltransferase involved in cell wall biosynthesis